MRLDSASTGDNDCRSKGNDCGTRNLWLPILLIEVGFVFVGFVMFFQPIE